MNYRQGRRYSLAIVLGVLLLISQASSALAQLPAGLISWWDGDLVSGATAFDLGSGIHGTLVNGATVAPGKVGNAFSFDGIDDFVQVPDSDLWAFGSSDFTINLWANFRSIAGGPSVLIGNDEGPGTTDKWFFVWTPSGGGALVLHFNGPTDSDSLVFDHSLLI